MPDRDIIHNYLKSLSNYLSRLEKSDAEDVTREIESHIHDVLDGHAQDGREITAEAILAGFGQPRELAAQYVDHILEGTAPPKGFNAIQRVKKEATRGLYWATGFLGYGIALLSIFLGLLKLFAPEMVAVWGGSPGNSFVVGVLSGVPEGSHEISAWWLTPVAIGVGIGAGYLTKRLLGVLKKKT
jgi:uncharacterized membrane protein